MTLLISRLVLSALVLLVAAFAFRRFWTREPDLFALLKKPSESIPVKPPFPLSADNRAQGNAVRLLASRLVLSALVLLVAGSVFQRIWTREPDLVALLNTPSEAIPVKSLRADMSYSISTVPYEYREGAVVHGLSWQPDYYEYRLKLKNTSPDSAATDVRVEIDLIGGVVLGYIAHQDGVQMASILDDETDLFAGNGLGIQRQVEAYSNQLRLNVQRMNP